MPRRKSTPATTSVDEPTPTKYRTLTDLHYKGKRVPANKLVTDLPESSIPWLLKGNYIKKVG